MSLAERACNFKPLTVNNCQTCAWYDHLTPDDQAGFHTLAGYADTGQISLAHLFRIVHDEGYPCTESSLKRHLRNCRDSR